MNRFRVLVSSLLLAAVACRRPSHAPPEHTKVAVVEFSVSPTVKVEAYGGNVASLGMSIAQAIAEEIHDDALDAQAIAHTVPPEGDLIVRGEITHVYGGNLAVVMTGWVCLFCGWWTGNAALAVQGEVVRPDGTVVGVFSNEVRTNSWGEAKSVALAAKIAGNRIGGMVKRGEYRGGHPGSDGYLADGFLAPVSVADHAAEYAPAERSPADRLRALDDLRAQGLVSDAEYAEKRKQILLEF